MITPTIISRLAPELSKAIEQSLPLALLVLDTNGCITDANSYALTCIGSSWKEGMSFSSILEDASSLPAFQPGTSHTKLLRLVGMSNGTLVMRCSFIFADNEGVVLMLPASAGREDGMTVMSQVNDQLSALTRELSQKNAALELARKEIRTLSGLLPICSHCKKINKGDDKWEAVESYVRKRTDADFTHSYCPDCYEKIMKELEEDS